MAKKISIIIIAVAIVAIGIISFNRLNYWDRSARIFTTNTEQSFRRGFDRGRPNFEGRENFNQRERSERPDLQNLPDSVVQQRIEALRRDGASRERNFEGRGGRGDFRQRGNIRLSNVGRFLAVFALFTTVTFYIDKFITTSRRKKRPNN